MTALADSGLVTVQAPGGSAARPARRDNVSLNAVRVACSVTVVISHIQALFLRRFGLVRHTFATRALYAPTFMGHAAVIIFFVLSGYWIGGSIVRSVRAGRFSWLRFATQRLTRLLIVLVPALALTLIADEVALHFFLHTDPISHTSAYAQMLPASLPAVLNLKTALVNLAFLQTIHWTPAFGNDTPLWTLAFEFWYYLLFPAALLAVRRGGRLPRRLAYFVLFLVAARFVHVDNVLKDFLLWVVGAGVAYQAPAIARGLGALSHRQETILRGCLLVAVLAAMLADRTWPGSYLGHFGRFTGDVVVGLVAAALMALLTVDPGWGFMSRPVTRFSRYSRSTFSLYAIHLPLLTLLAAALVPRVAHRWAPSVWSALAVAAIALSAIAVAWVFAHFTEHHTDALRIRVQAGLRRLGLESPPDQATIASSRATTSSA